MGKKMRSVTLFIVTMLLLVVVTLGGTAIPVLADDAADAALVASAKDYLGDLTLSPVEGTDTNLVTMVQDFLDAYNEGEYSTVTVTLGDSDNAAIAVDGVITYGDPASFVQTFNLTKGLTADPIDIPVELPNSDANEVALAKAALTGITLNPMEGTDSNIVTMVQALVDAAADGVTVTFVPEDMVPIAANGEIDYSLNEMFTATFILTKNAATDSIGVYTELQYPEASAMTLGGLVDGTYNKLRYTVYEDGAVAAYVYDPNNEEEGPDDEGYVYQYYSEDDWGSTFFFDQGDTPYSFGSPYYVDGDMADFGAGTQTLLDVDGGQAVKTVWLLNEGDVELTQLVTYIDGASQVEKTWTIKNLTEGDGAADMEGIRFLHGGDAYFAGNDDARCYYDASQKMVYLKNEDMTKSGLMRFNGSDSTPADHYEAGYYDDVTMDIYYGELLDYANEEYDDAGYGLEWDQDTLAAGDSWTIISYESWSDPGTVQVIAPADKSTPSGTMLTFEFTVQNFLTDDNGDAANDTFNLTATSEAGWATDIQGNSSITVAGDGGTAKVFVDVTVPAETDGDTDTITLEAVSSIDAARHASNVAGITVDDSLKTIVSVDATPNSIVKGQAKAVAVAFTTLNIDDGAAFTVELLDSDKVSLEEPIVADPGTILANAGSAVLSLPGTLPAGVYYVNVSVEGAIRDDNFQTITITAQHSGGGHHSSGSVTIPVVVPPVVVPPVAVPPAFVDITNHWAEGDIDLLAAQNIVEGVSTDKFEPNRVVTRAEFAAVLVRALKLNKDDLAGTNFADVTDGKWYFEDIAAADEAGIVLGISLTDFAPDKNITREEMAVMMSRALKHLGKGVPASSDTLKQFSDEQKIGDWAREDVAFAVANKIIKGRTATNFVPKASATRAEATTMIKRLLDI